MWPTNWIDEREAVDALLERWDNTQAQVWEYTVGHSQLLVRFYKEPPDQMQSAFVLCLACSEVYFQSDWRAAAPRVTIDPAAEHRSFLFQDGERLRVICGNVTVVEMDCQNDFPRLSDQLASNVGDQ